MQAVRWCSVCASHADISMLRNNMSMLRRGAACIRVLSSSESDHLKKLEVQKLGEWTDPTSLSVGRGICAVPQVENLSHDSLIRRAASVVTDSSSTFLSQTTLAFIDALTDYSKAVHTRIVLQRRYLASLGKMTAAEEDSLKRMINVMRAEVIERLNECKRFESSWISAVNLAQLAADAASTSGGEQASITLRTNIQLAQAQVEETRKLSANTDKKLAETKVEEIQRMAEYAASLETGEDHEVHEAYLRED